MKIVVLVDKEGNTQTIVKGVQGSACMSASRFLTDNLGTIIEDTQTEEYSGLVLTENNEQTAVNTQVCRVQDDTY